MEYYEAHTHLQYQGFGVCCLVNKKWTRDLVHWKRAFATQACQTEFNP